MIRIDIINDGTGTKERGNYTYDITLPAKRMKGEYKGFPRDAGWRTLVENVIEKAWNDDYIAAVEKLAGEKLR